MAEKAANIPDRVVNILCSEKVVLDPSLSQKGGGNYTFINKQGDRQESRVGYTQYQLKPETAEKIAGISNKIIEIIKSALEKQEFYKNPEFELLFYKNGEGKDAAAFVEQDERVKRRVRVGINVDAYEEVACLGIISTGFKQLIASQGSKELEKEAREILKERTGVDYVPGEVEGLNWLYIKVEDPSKKRRSSSFRWRLYISTNEKCHFDLCIAVIKSLKEELFFYAKFLLDWKYISRPSDEYPKIVLYFDTEKELREFYERLNEYMGPLEKKYGELPIRDKSSRLGPLASFEFSHAYFRQKVEELRGELAYALKRVNNKLATARLFGICATADTKGGKINTFPLIKKELIFSSYFYSKGNTEKAKEIITNIGRYQVEALAGNDTQNVWKWYFHARLGELLWHMNTVLPFGGDAHRLAFEELFVLEDKWRDALGLPAPDLSYSAPAQYPIQEIRIYEMYNEGGKIIRGDKNSFDMKPGKLNIYVAAIDEVTRSSGYGYVNPTTTGLYLKTQTEWGYKISNGQGQPIEEEIDHGFGSFEISLTNPGTYQLEVILKDKNGKKEWKDQISLVVKEKKPEPPKDNSPPFFSDLPRISFLTEKIVTDVVEKKIDAILNNEYSLPNLKKNGQEDPRTEELIINKLDEPEKKLVNLFRSKLKEKEYVCRSYVDLRDFFKDACREVKRLALKGLVKREPNLKEVLLDFIRIKAKTDIMPLLKIISFMMKLECLSNDFKNRMILPIKNEVSKKIKNMINVEKVGSEEPNQAQELGIYVGGITIKELDGINKDGLKNLLQSKDPIPRLFVSFLSSVVTGIYLAKIYSAEEEHIIQGINKERSKTEFPKLVQELEKFGILVISDELIGQDWKQLMDSVELLDERRQRNRISGEIYEVTSPLIKYKGAVLLKATVYVAR